MLVDQFEKHIGVRGRDGDELIPMRNSCGVGIGPARKGCQLDVETVALADVEEVGQAFVVIRVLTRDQPADRLMLWTLRISADVEVGPHAEQVEARVGALPQNRRDVLAAEEAIEEIEIGRLDPGPPRAGLLSEKMTADFQTR